MKDHAEQLQRLKSELTGFTLMVAHDLRAPLAGIAGFAEALAERIGGDGDPKAAHYLSRIRSGVTRMDALLTGLARLAAVGAIELQCGVVDLGALAEDAMESLRAASPQRAVVVEVQQGMRACGDVRLLHTLLENLLGNAWKFTAGCPVARIHVGQRPDGAFFVQDNGVGFDMAMADQLFVPFRRLHPDDEFEGVGIGLASARHVVECHAGRIWADSQPGDRTVFWFTLAAPAA
ncbi:MAG: putative histidine kinase, classic [Ramlibacter sp.]|nr:putative histidine kinase, classic [Ramlibacter sp.]